MKNQENIDEKLEKLEHERTLRKFQHLDVDTRRAKLEALENLLKDTQKKFISNPQVRESVLRDLNEKRTGVQQPNTNLLDFIKKTGGTSTQADFDPGFDVDEIGPTPDEGDFI